MLIVTKEIHRRWSMFLSVSFVGGGKWRREHGNRMQESLCMWLKQLHHNAYKLHLGICIPGHWVFSVDGYFAITAGNCLVLLLLTPTFTHPRSPQFLCRECSMSSCSMPILACFFFAQNQLSITRQPKMVFIYKNSGMLSICFYLMKKCGDFYQNVIDNLAI